MARLQILELPEGSGDDRPPFVLVVDQCMPRRIALGADAPYRDYWHDLADKIGARGVIVTPETVDIPANDLTAHNGEAGSESGDPNETRRVALCDALLISLGSTWDQIIEQAAERMHTVADLHRRTDGQRLADERTDIARDMDRLAKWRDELADALGVDRTRDWDDIRNAATGLRKQGDEQAAAVERVRNLPDQPQDASAEYENPNAYLLGYLNATREAKRAITNPPAADA